MRKINTARAVSRAAMPAPEYPAPEYQLVRALAVAAFTLAALFMVHLQAHSWLGALPFSASWQFLLQSLVTVFALVLALAGAAAVWVSTALLRRLQCFASSQLTPERESGLQQAAFAGLISLASGLYALYQVWLAA